MNQPPRAVARRVRHEVRDGLAVALLSAAMSTAVALILVVLGQGR